MEKKEFANRPGWAALLLAGLAVLFLFPAEALPRPDGEADRIVAIVNKRVITKSEVEALLGPAAQTLGFTGKKREEELQKLYMKQLVKIIRDEVLYQAGKKEGLTATREQVQEQIKKDIKQAGSKAKFLKILSSQGLTLGEKEEELKRELTGSNYVWSRFRRMRGRKKEVRPAGDIEVSPEEMRRYYKNHLEEFTQEDSVRVRVIFLPFSAGEEPEKTWERGRDIEKKIREGEDFGALAGKHSALMGEKDGDIGWFGRRSDKLDLIKDFAFQNKPGTVSPLLESPTGLWILKVEERKEEKKIPFMQAQESIISLIKNEKWRALLVEEEKRLLRQAYVWPSNIKEILLNSY